MGALRARSGSCAPTAPSGRSGARARGVSFLGDSLGLVTLLLYVANSTVKTHLSNLFRKLGAHSRTHAVTRARNLDLI
jgi:Bacterial regulatory proteins, luxR family